MREKCDGCGRVERCEYCGRFMTHWWHDGGYEREDWNDWWECSLQEKHAAEHPQDFGLVGALGVSN